jgi:predicted MFS family arabinose efflux permease
LTSLVVSRAHPSDRGSAVSLFTAIFDTGILFGGPSLGFLASATDLRTMFAGAASLPIVGAILFFVWERDRGVIAEAPTAE